MSLISVYKINHNNNTSQRREECEWKRNGKTHIPHSTIYLRASSGVCMRVHTFKNRNGSLCYIVINKIANTQIETINDDNNTAMSNAIYLLHQISIRNARVQYYTSFSLFVRLLLLQKSWIWRANQKIPSQMLLNPVRFHIFVTQNWLSLFFLILFRFF